MNSQWVWGGDCSLAENDLVLLASHPDPGIRIREAGSTQLTVLRKPREVLQRDTGWLSPFAAVCLSGMAAPRPVSSASCDQALPALSWPCTGQESGCPCLSLGSAQRGPRGHGHRAGQEMLGHAA